MNLIKQWMKSNGWFSFLHYFPHLMKGVKGEDFDLGEIAKNAFRGGSQERSFEAAQVNVTDMYNYCHEYKSIHKKLANDEKI